MTRDDLRDALALIASIALIVAGGMFAAKILFAQRGLSVLCVP